MSPSEAGKIGYIKTRQQLEAASARRRQEAKARHNASLSSCGFCGEMIAYEKRRNKFCNRSCAARFNNRGVTRHSNSVGNVLCRRCGQPISKSGRIFCGLRCANARLADATERKLAGDVTGAPVSATATRRYLLKTRGEFCELCGWSEHHPVTGHVPLEVDHVDGNANNNHLANLRLICPNCHSLTPTFRALNKGNGREHRRKRAPLVQRLVQ